MREKKVKSRMGKRILEIRGIEFDWIFNNKEGKDFLKNLGKTDNLDLFENSLIKIIIDFLWKIWFRAIFWMVFIPFIFMMITYLIYVTEIHYGRVKTPKAQAFNSFFGYGSFDWSWKTYTNINYLIQVI